MPMSFKPAWLVLAGLILLALVPVIAGGARLAELAGQPEVTPSNARFVTAPVPVVLHIVSVTTYALLGAFQFSDGLRRSHPRWHRIAGRVLVLAGLLAALSGLWMTQAYTPPPMDRGLTLYLVRIAVGTGMTASLTLGIAAIRRGDITRHRAWMMRAYGLGMGAGTQVLTHLPWTLLIEMPNSTTTRDVLMGAGWAINIAIVEWVLVRRTRLGRQQAVAPLVS
ncbi:hypothetical protein Rumeso_04289 [Rubellimicrobium mesophilum DSM 19309]|uniref:DUF2306 domain-containing protein n=1 Tax=Rubellimicrobium mesophilum DSM 19309 TaxID=442562 RepID=A0A017HI92_9RHOB|nr:DUF2306 domain-containing protein [Rubellimicrobium mesophilum]EYD74232.1 hypothetical protein Rumeso_04289 [Rubellimicrobium mesophilum DSM 19309]